MLVEGPKGAKNAIARLAGSLKVEYVINRAGWGSRGKKRIGDQKKIQFSRQVKNMVISFVAGGRGIRDSGALACFGQLSILRFIGGREQ
jgi:hypothetical protein